MPETIYIAVPAGAYVHPPQDLVFTRKSRYLGPTDSDQLNDEFDLLAVTLKDRIGQPMDVYEVSSRGTGDELDRSDLFAPDALWTVLVWQYSNEDEVFLRTHRKGQKHGEFILLDDGEIRIPAEEARHPGEVLDYARRALDHLDLIG